MSPGHSRRFEGRFWPTGVTLPGGQAATVRADGLGHGLVKQRPEEPSVALILPSRLGTNNRPDLSSTAVLDHIPPAHGIEDGP